MPPQLNPDAAGRGGLLLSLLLLAALTAVVLSTRPLSPIDETRYVGVAWEMWLRGDFLVPFKNGEPYSHKPPLLFWMIHAGWALFGVNDTWPRLVLPLFSAVALVLTFLLARRLWPQQHALGGQAALILASSLLWMVFSTALMFDVMLAFWVLLGLHGVLAASAGRWHGFILLAIAIGLGMLTKGPVVLLNLLPVAVLAPWWHPGLPQSAQPVNDRIRWGRWFAGLGLAVLAGVAITLAWAIPAGLAGGEAYRNAIFWGQTADRMVESFAHARPFWWYLPLLPLLLFPWCVWPGLWQALAHHRARGLDRGTRFCLAWMLPVFIALMFISGKQPHYLLPLFPAFALLAARVLADRPAHRVGVPAALVAALGVALVAAGSGRFVALQDQVAAWPPLWPGALLVLLGVTSWAAGRRGVPATLNLALLSTFMLMLVQWVLLHTLSPRYDIEPMAQAIKQVQDAGGQVAHAGKYHAQYQFAGRLQAPLPELHGGELPRWLAAHPDGFVVMYPEHSRNRDAIAAHHRQAYRGGLAVLADARAAAGLLAVQGE
ncbi:MAG: glycosyltransferase family 39 protein [Thiobacillus sp.]|nr:glycosyltransferase family 39 protein [Thiobacillus sp.]